MIGFTHNIKSIPKDGVIKKAGRYVLNHDIKSDSRFALRIMANDVEVDLCGYSVISMNKSSDVESAAIHVSDSTNIVVRNGKVIGGWHGVQLINSELVNLYDLSITNFAYIGLNTKKVKYVNFIGNRVNASVEENNRPESDYYCIGVNICGKNCRFENNTITAEYGVNLEKRVEVVLVLLTSDAKKCTFINNNLFSIEPIRGSYGIWVAGFASVSLLNNYIHNPQYGIVAAADANVEVSNNRLTFDITPWDIEIGDDESQGIFLASERVKVSGNIIDGYSYDIVDINASKDIKE